MMHRQLSEIRNFGGLGATSRVVFELKPFGILIRGAIGSEPWVGRRTVKMSGTFTQFYYIPTQPQGFFRGDSKLLRRILPRRQKGIGKY